MNDKMKNLAIRTVSGMGLLVVVWGAILWSPESLLALVALMTIFGLREFYDLAACRGLHPQRVLGTLAGLMLLWIGAAAVATVPGRFVACGAAFLLLLPFAMFVCELYRKQTEPLANIGATLLGVLYVALPLALLVLIPAVGSASARNPWVLVAYICIVWSNDVFAYLVGMTFGRRPLFPRLSPKKSWEGFFGGLAGAVAAGAVAARLLDASAAAWCGLALVAAVTAVLGDLAESMLKRSAGVKDSGALIPGHGGILDRFDALLLSAPFVFVYMFFVF